MIFSTAVLALAFAAGAPGDEVVTLQGIGPLRVGITFKFPQPGDQWVHESVAAL